MAAVSPRYPRSTKRTSQDQQHDAGAGDAWPATFPFTNSTVDAVPVPADGRAQYRDANNPALILRVTSTGTKSFCVGRKVNGKFVRVTLGTFKRAGDRTPRMSVELAVKAVRREDGKIAEGVNPNIEKRKARAVGRTVEQTLNAYIAMSTLKPRTVSDYSKVLGEFCEDWLSKPLASVTREQLQARHRRHSEQRSPARADNAVRVLRALFNFAGIRPNPASSPKKRTVDGNKSFMNNVARKRTLLSVEDFPAWWAAVEGLEGKRSDSGAQTASDFLLTLALTGLRFGEAASLRWDNVDRRTWTITIPDTKNRDPHVLPVGPKLEAILERRWDERAGPFVFGSIEDPKQPYSMGTCYAWVRAIEAECGVKVNPHDLRRTFATTADALDIGTSTVKRLLNHRTGRHDVTDGYIVVSPERLRGAMERIEVQMLAWSRGDKGDVSP